MNKDLNENELDELKQRFEAVGTPRLPSSLRSEALFSKLDEQAEKADTSQNSEEHVVHIRWKRWGTLAAAVLVAVGLYAASQQGAFGGASSTRNTAPELTAGAADNGTLYSASQQEDAEKNDASVAAQSPSAHGWDREGECAASPESRGGLLTFSQQDAAKASVLLGRLSWSPIDLVNGAGYTFSLSGKDYEYDAAGKTIYNYTDNLMASLSPADVAALTALCQAAQENAEGQG